MSPGERGPSAKEFSHFPQVLSCDWWVKARSEIPARLAQARDHHVPFRGIMKGTMNHRFGWPLIPPPALPTGVPLAASTPLGGRRLPGPHVLVDEQPGPNGWGGEASGQQL